MLSSQTKTRSRRISHLVTASAIAAVLSAPVGAEEITPIYEIQGASHISELAGETVITTGIVTAVAFNGFYVQDAIGDGDEDTSDGIFVFSSDPVSLGDEVRLTGEVSEFVPGGAATGNLSITELFRPAVEVLSSGNQFPAPVVIGRSGRVPPNVDVISADETDPPIDLQDPADVAANNFDPELDGIDFYESLEGMRVKIEEPVAVSGTRTFTPFSSELFVLANRGKDVAPKDARTRRGGINLQPDPDNRGDQNPERVQIQLDGTLFPGEVPAIKVGDRLGDVTGVVGYSFGNFEVNATDLFDIEARELAQEETKLVGKRSKVTVASYNLLNLSPDASDDNQRAALASQILDNLHAPDVIALQEIQDNSGETDDGTVDATETLQALADAIVAAGGPVYDFFDVAPVDGTSGGVPGGNIRNAFLYNALRVGLVGFESLTSDVLAASGVSNADAFTGTRDPLLARFAFKGREFTVINNHFTSRFGSTPIFGATQPFVQEGEAEREAQALALNEFVDRLLRDDPKARVIVLGDLNTFEFTNDLTEILPGEEPILTNLIDRIKDYTTQYPSPPPRRLPRAGHRAALAPSL
ncbi:MAG: endonuclease/exonuclease/phosphatase family protein [Pseudomonadota bacterium]|nr:endonuclease/exonuclease/phosphatase family protein [Pseudomonadota bacterium]